MKKGIITVVGKDSVGIIAKICTYLAKHQMNILDISQTIKGEFFYMMMIVDVTNELPAFNDHVKQLQELGETIAVSVNFQLEDIFNTMHRI